MQLGDVNKRLLAHFIDFNLYGIVFSLMMPLLFGEQWQAWLLESIQLMQQQQSPNMPSNPAIILAGIFIPILYPALWWRFVSATPAQFLFGLRVVQHDSHRPLAFWQCVIRGGVLYYLSMFMMLVWIVGVISAVVFTISTRKQPQHRALHDMLSGSVVLSTVVSIDGEQKDTHADSPEAPSDSKNKTGQREF